MMGVRFLLQKAIKTNSVQSIAGLLGPAAVDCENNIIRFFPNLFHFKDLVAPDLQRLGLARTPREEGGGSGANHLEADETPRTLFWKCSNPQAKGLKLRPESVRSQKQRAPDFVLRVS